MHTLLNQRVASGDFWGGKDGFGCRSGSTSAWTGLAQVRVIPSSAEHLPRTQMHSVLSLNRPSSILCPQTFHCPLFIPCTSRSSSFPTPGNSQNNPMEGGEGTLASFRLHRTHTPHPTHNLRAVPHPPPKPQPGVPISRPCRTHPRGHGAIPGCPGGPWGSIPGCCPPTQPLPLRNGMEREETALGSDSWALQTRMSSLRYVY